MTVFSGTISVELITHPAPTTQPDVNSVDLPTVWGGKRRLLKSLTFTSESKPLTHLDSKTLLSPIFKALEVQSTSKTLLLPTIITGVVPWSPSSTLLDMVTRSSMRLFSPIMMGPLSASILAFGWTTVLKKRTIWVASSWRKVSDAPSRFTWLRWWRRRQELIRCKQLHQQQYLGPFSIEILLRFQCTLISETWKWEERRQHLCRIYTSDEGSALLGKEYFWKYS